MHSGVTVCETLETLSDTISKSFRPNSVSRSVRDWVDENSLPVERFRGQRCRSEPNSGREDIELSSQRRARSVPAMEPVRDADGFFIPSIPALSRRQSYERNMMTGQQASRPGSAVSMMSSQQSSGRSKGKSLVEDPFYRVRNLALNNIFFLRVLEELPEQVGCLVDEIRNDHHSLAPTIDEVSLDTALHNLEMGVTEAEVKDFFKSKIFPEKLLGDRLMHSSDLPFASGAVIGANHPHKVSIPKPDLVYGYNRGTFSMQQSTNLWSMGTEMVANSQDLLYPFFVAELKSDGPAGAGSLWVATNQCLGASASCVDMIERLNERLSLRVSNRDHSLNTTVFSIAMNGTEARLYVTWKQEKIRFLTRKIDSFLLQDPDHYVRFHKIVHSIIRWGKGRRFDAIRNSLDALFEQGTEET